MTFVRLVIFVVILPTISANCTRPELPAQRGCFLKIFDGQCENGQCTDGTEILYTCDWGYNLVGSAIVTCKGQNIWYPSPGKCVPDPTLSVTESRGTCTAPPPTNGTRTFSTNTVVNGRSPNGTRFGIKCNDGYYRTGPLISECENGSWKPSVSMCIPNDQAFCSKPEVPHGSIYFKSHLCSDRVKCSANFVAFIKCDQNYSLTGFGYTRCKGYEEWHPSVMPKCEATCAPLTIASGQVDSQALTLSNGRYNVGTTIYFSCEDGYNLKGSHSSTCQKTGTWSPQSPSCTLVSCQGGSKKNGKITYNKPSLNNGKYPVGTIRTFSCKRRYQLDGHKASVCLSSGDWSKADPHCRPAVTCRPLSLRNGRVKYIKNHRSFKAGRYPVGTKAFYFCNTLYKLQGSRSRTCQESGKWDQSTPKCKKGIKRGRGCFPSEAKVMLANGKLVRMSELKVGDLVQTVSSTGEVAYSEVRTFVKQQPNMITMYKSIRTLWNQTLALTEDHLVYARKYSADSFHAVFADQISIGDEVLVQRSDEVMPSMVINVSSLVMEGAYVPLSEDGNILVDGVLTSCYAGYSSVLAHFAIMPMQLFPNIIEWALGYDIGFPVYVHIALKLGTLLLPDGQIYGH